MRIYIIIILLLLSLNQALQNDDQELIIQNLKQEEQEDNNNEQLSADIKFGYKYIPLNQNLIPKLVPTTITINSPNNKEYNKSPTDLIAIIDVSGSMQGNNKLELIKETFEFIIDNLNENDRLSIITFSSDAKRLTPLLNVDTNNRNKLLDTIFNMKAGGMTNINAGINEAMKVIKDRRYKNKLTNILLLSDGHDNTSYNPIENINKTIKNQELNDDYRIFTFGYGTDHDSRLMSDIAEYNNGMFQYIKDPKDAKTNFADCIGGIVNVYAKDIRIDLIPSNNVNINHVYNTKWNKTNFKEINLSNIQHGTNTDIVVMLELDSDLINNKINDNKILLQSIDLKYMNVANNNIYSIKKDLQVSMSNIDKLDQNNYVISNQIRVNYSKTIKTIADYTYNQQYEKARTLIKSEIDNINSYGINNKMTSNQIKELEEIKDKLDNEGQFKEDNVNASLQSSQIGNERQQSQSSFDTGSIQQSESQSDQVGLSKKHRSKQYDKIIL